MTGVVVRPVEVEDKAEWCLFWCDYLAFYQTERPDDVYNATFPRLLSPDPAEFRGQVAVADGRLVGLVHYLYLRTNWGLRNTCYLQDLYADPAVRSTGVGRALIQAVYAAVDRDDVQGPYWFTAADNATARQLYDRIGVKTPFIRYRRP